MGNKGTRYERVLMNTLEEQGYSVVRAGASGGGTDGDRPDLLAGRDGGKLMWCIEAKFTSSTTAYAKSDEVEALERFASGFGATPVIAARFKGERVFWLVHPADCRLTDAGSFGVPRAERKQRSTHAIRETS